MKLLSSKLLQQLIQARKAKGWTQAELGHRLGLPQSHISELEQGRIEPRSGSLTAWARALDLELTWVPKQLVPAITQLVQGDTTERSLATMLLEDDE